MKIDQYVDINTFLDFIFPVILLYGIYIQFNGNTGFGGGFQSGVLIASAFIAKGEIYGYKNIFEIIPNKVIKLLGFTGVLMYISVGLIDILSNHKFLSYKFLKDTYLLSQSIGMFVIEIGVLFAVFYSMLTIYLSLVGNE